MKRLLLALICLMIPVAGLAASEYQVAKRVEASMVVTGWIVVNPDGSVNSYTLDRQKKLPPEVLQILAATVPSWKFQPIPTPNKDGRPELAKAKMSLRVVASPAGAGNYAISIHGVSFGTGDSSKDPTVKSEEPPRYPRDALERGISGVVYLALQVDGQGHVDKVDAQQVDLRLLANDGELKAWSRALTIAAARAARNWTFEVPKGALNQNGHAVVRVPVNFEIGYPRDEYGQWDAYIPGPVKQIPWLDTGSQAMDGSADSIPNNGLAFQDDSRFVLLNLPNNG